MSHEHNIIDTDCRFSINAITRAITSRSEKISLAQYDHESERFTFQINRYIEEHDMTQCDRIEIHYTNITRNKKQQNDDVYIVKDLDKGSDLDTAVFSWLITREATQLVGTLKFWISFLCFDDEGNETYKWSTNVYDQITIFEKGDHTATVIESKPDLIESMKQEILDSIPSSGGGSVSEEEVEQIVIEYLEANPPSQGKDGEDGVSPTIAVEETENGYNITIEDVNDSQTIELKNGTDGQDGKSPYQYALDGGYEGTEEEFTASFVQMVSSGYVITSETILNGGSANGSDN